MLKKNNDVNNNKVDDDNGDDNDEGIKKVIHFKFNLKLIIAQP